MDIKYLIRRAARQFKDKIAIMDGERKLSFTEVYKNANRLANGLIGKGLQKGDKVNVFSENSYQILEIYLGLAIAGLVRVPLRARESRQNNIFEINNCEATTLIFDQKFLDIVTSIKPEIKGVMRFVCRSDDPSRLPDWIFDYDRLLSEASPAEVQVEINEDDMFRMGHSGGTTGVPKATVQTFKTEMAFTMHLLLDVLLLTSQDVFLHIHPMSHGSGTFILPCWIRGVKQVIARSAKPDYLLETIEKESISSTFMVPTVLIRMIDFPGVSKYDCSSLSRVFYGAAPCPPDKIMKAVKTFGPVFCQVYGSSEVPTGVTVLPPEDHIIEGSVERMLRRFSSIGRESLSCQVRIVDKDDKEMPVGEIGEIIVKSEYAMKEYYNKPEETAEALRGGWVHTRDMGYMDEDGYFYLVGRTTEMIISGGFNIYPKEIEDILYAHPAVKEACVIGVPHKEWGEEVKALIYFKDGETATEEELIKFCRNKLAHFKCPKSIEFPKIEPPRTSVGKTDKKALTAQYWKDQKRAI